MAGLVPAIHALLAAGCEDVGARDKPGHDAEGCFQALPHRHSTVMAGLVPAIHALLAAGSVKTWVPGTSSGMTPRDASRLSAPSWRKPHFRFAAARFFFRAKTFLRSARSLAFFFRQEMHLQPTALMKQSK